jgi:hypothetical protein
VNLGTLATRVCILVLLAAALAGCGTTKQAAKPKVQTIAVIPVVDPDWYTLQNDNAIRILSPIVGTGTLVDSRAKAKVLTARMLAQNTHLGDRLTKELVDALNQQGFQARVASPRELEGVDLGDIDYEKFKADADAVLHVRFTEVGVTSGMSSLDYLPKVDVSGYLFNPRDGSSIAEEVVYYGADGRKGTAWSVAADSRYAYRTFDDLIEKVSELATGFQESTRATATRMAENLRKTLLN